MPYLDDTAIQAFFPNPLDRFINRELSWLSFNHRVLQEASNPHHPLLERVRFLSISASNLDEFTMVRVAGLKDLVRHQMPTVSEDGLTPQQQLTLIQERARQLITEQQICWSELKNALIEENIVVIGRQDLTHDEKAWLHTHFVEQIFPVLTPLAIDPAHPFPFLPNLGMASVFELKRRTNGQLLNAIVPLPMTLSRFIQLPQISESLRLIPLEEALHHCHAHLFTSCDILHAGVIRITRDSELDISDEAEDLVSHFEWAVKQRRLGIVIRLEANKGMPSSLLTFAIEQLQVAPEDVVETSDFLHLASLKELVSIERPELKFAPYVVRFPERISDYGGNCLEAIHAKDIIVHHPYESFDVVIRFLKQAARDPDVIAIKQTLYRTSDDSDVAKALIEAAEAGKSVTVVVELKARFDEEANIRWARNLERAGAQVVFGLTGLKTHAKISMVIKRVGDHLRTFVHFGTGNYHPITATVYSDLSFFTCDPALCRDAAHLFNYLTGYSPPQRLEKIAMAPLTLRHTLVQLIDQEIAHAKAGRPASIWIKANALVDPELIDALYYASQQGVKIELMIRGICCLRPGIPGFSDNIRVKSMVGRFLEHARIFCFGNGLSLPSSQAKVFIASADWMRRNMHRRVEVLVPIENATVHEQVLGQIMQANVKDQQQSWYLQADGSYTRVPFSPDNFSAHAFFMTNPSLSGRGTALSPKP